MNYNETKTVIDLSGAQNISELGLKITTILDSEGVTNKDLFLNLGNIDLKQSQLLSIKALIETMQSKLTGIQTTSEITRTSAIGLGLVVGNANQDNRPTFEESFKSSVNSNTTDEITSFSQLKQNSIGDIVTDTADLPEIHDNNLQKETEEFLAEVRTEDEENDKNIDESDLFKSQTNVYEELSKTASNHDEIQSALDVTFGSGNINENASEIINNGVNNETIMFPSSAVHEDTMAQEVTETVEKEDDGKYILLDTEGITPEGIELIKSNTSDLSTLYLTQTLRSGQTVSYEGNIFLVGDAHPGSEIIATGDVTIWGILGGIVHAGSKGNMEAKVRALKLNPIQLRIANLYSRRNDTVNVPYVQKTNEFTPEEARIENEQIVIYKTLRRED